MSENTENENTEVNTEETNTTPNAPVEKPNNETSNDDEFVRLKGNLDKAYGERDALKEEVNKLKQAKRDEEIQRLKDEGKEREAFEAQLADKDAKIEALEHRIVELTRDNEVRQVLSTHSFRNERAVALAYDSIIKELVQDEKGNWVHRSGKSVRDFIQGFSEDEENKFLFAVKENRGSGNPPTTQPSVPPTKSSGKLSGMSQKEVLAMARKGRLPNQRR